MRSRKMNEKPLILIVDDEPEILKLYEHSLEAAGFEVVTAENGLLGIEAAKREKKPDLILMDIKMPLMDGPEAFVKLKEDQATKNIKIVFLTAFSDIGMPEIDVSYAKELGAADFIKKGIDLDEFVVRVKKSLGR